jgi:hypothetical protein
MNNQKIIIPFQKEGMKAASAVFLFLIIILLGFFYLSTVLHKFLGHYITFFIQSIIAIMIALFLIGFIFAIFQNKEPEDLARLTNEGIWVRNFGFIPWNEIAIFDNFQYGTPMINIGIRVKDSKKLFKQANLSGKMAIFWSKIFGYPPIIIANTDMDNEQIISFARRFLSDQQ